MDCRERLRDLLVLNQCEGLGTVRLRSLLRVMGSERNVLEAGDKDLRAVAGIGPKTVEGLRRARAACDPDRELERAEARGAAVVPYYDPAYPLLLGETYGAPLLLYIMGRMEKEDEFSAAVVGARRCTIYGRRMAERLAADLALHRYTVVSGLARGIDTHAHRGALTAGGRTLAVLGSGLDRPYPPENAGLLEKIAGQGAVITEFPMEMSPDRFHFPRRNRIISGLSRGVVVVEAGRRSGAMSTARWALDQNREVMAVPGKIDSPQSAGTNSLIAGGAKLVASVEDILEELPEPPGGIRRTSRRGEGDAPTAEEQTVLDHLEEEPRALDELVGLTGLRVERLSAVLFTLEMKRRVIQYPGKVFARA